ncbi:MAG: hypothetical protein EOM54_11995 [Clostridia bacterium]|nr:hypothetical protein [Clostridia bacterium]
MTDLQEVLARIEAERPEYERIIEERRQYHLKLDTGRHKKSLCCIPTDTDFAERDGNTEYEVFGHFDPYAEEYIINKVIRKLGLCFRDEDSPL